MANTQGQGKDSAARIITLLGKIEMLEDENARLHAKVTQLENDLIQITKVICTASMWWSGEDVT